MLVVQEVSWDPFSEQERECR